MESVLMSVLESVNGIVILISAPLSSNLPPSTPSSTHRYILMNGDIDEESISLESLQAQIDMSMSFATSMISGWVKPTAGRVGSSKRKELEAELLNGARLRPR